LRVGIFKSKDSLRRLREVGDRRIKIIRLQEEIQFYITPLIQPKII
jgi:hypothetical protein